MKKRYFKIVLINGKEHNMPFEKAFREPFIPDLPPTTVQFLKVCEAIAMTGFMEEGTDARPRWIAPAQIKYIEVVIEPQKNNDSKIVTLSQ